MKKITIAAIVILFVFVNSSLALTLVKSTPTPKNKFRFTTGNEYVSSFVPAYGLKFDSKRVKNALEKHFSEERESNVSGLIWENCPEGSEVMFQIYKTGTNEYLGDIRVSTDYFSHDGNFFYRIGQLQNALKTAFGFEVDVNNIRKKGDNGRQEIIFSENDFMILKL